MTELHTTDDWQRIISIDLKGLDTKQIMERRWERRAREIHRAKTRAFILWLGVCALCWFVIATSLWMRFK